jgi:hypothetical protein
MADKSALGAVNRPLRMSEYVVNQHIMTKLRTGIDGLNTNFSLRCLFFLDEET